MQHNYLLTYLFLFFFMKNLHEFSYKYSLVLSEIDRSKSTPTNENQCIVTKLRQIVQIPNLFSNAHAQGTKQENNFLTASSGSRKANFFFHLQKAPLIQEYYANTCSFKNIMLFQEHYALSRTLCSFKNDLLKALFQENFA